jgi:hypothetical protein
MNVMIMMLRRTRTITTRTPMVFLFYGDSFEGTSKPGSMYGEQRHKQLCHAMKLAVEDFLRMTRNKLMVK